MLQMQLIGSDGIWSNTRKQIHLDEPVESQYVAYRGTVPTEQIAAANLDDVVMWIGPESAFGTLSSSTQRTI